MTPSHGSYSAPRHCVAFLTRCGCGHHAHAFHTRDVCGADVSKLANVAGKHRPANRGDRLQWRNADVASGVVLRCYLHFAQAVRRADDDRDRRGGEGYTYYDGAVADHCDAELAKDRKSVV